MNYVDTVTIGSTRYLRLHNFATGSSSLRQQHIDFLKQWVRQNYQSNRSYRIVGLASNLRYRDRTEERNYSLSLERALSVERRISIEVLELWHETNPHSALVPSFSATVLGVSNSWNQPEGDDENLAGHRAVLICPQQFSLPGQLIIPEVPSLRPHRNFGIKLDFSVSVGVPVRFAAVRIAGVSISDPNGCRQNYFFGQAEVGVGTPSVERSNSTSSFTTPNNEYVNSFSGHSWFESVGATAGNASISETVFHFASGKGVDGGDITARFDTQGLGIGAGIGLMGYLHRTEVVTCSGERIAND